MTDRRAIAISIALTTLLVAGCGASTAPSPTAAAAAIITASPVASATASASAAASPSASSGDLFSGTTGRITNETDGYTITLPDGWLRLDMSAEDIDAMVSAASASSPETAAVLESQMGALILAGVKFWAIQTDSQDFAFPSNANIIEQPMAGATLDLLEQITVAQLEQSETTSGGTVAHERVDLPSGEALHLNYLLKTTDATGAAVEATVEQFAIPHGSKMLILSIAGIDPAKTVADADRMARSLTFAD